MDLAEHSHFTEEAIDQTESQQIKSNVEILG